MHLSFAIMAHPTRGDLAGGVVARVPAARIVWDERDEEWDTGRRALLGFDPDADYHVVIQDDAVVPEAFEEALSAALPHADGLPVGLYLGRVRPRHRLVSKIVAKALEAEASWVEMGGPWWGVAVAFPTEIIEEIVERGDEMRHPHYDYRLARAVKESGRRCRYPVPSLVDHDPSVPSLIDSAGGDRRAHVFIGDRDHPASIDWSRSPVSLDYRGKIVVPTPA